MRAATKHQTHFAEDNNPVLADESADRRREKKKKTQKHLPLLLPG
jgi:hypothetical protein